MCFVSIYMHIVYTSMYLTCALCPQCVCKDASSHDGDWNYYKQQAYEQKDVITDQRVVITQLSTLLETYGHHIPTVRTMT